MKLSKRLEVLKIDVKRAYKKYVPNKLHKFYNSELDNPKEIIDELIDTDELTNLPQIYFNRRTDGVEVEGYVLAVSRYAGLLVWNYSDSKLVNIGFSQINGIQEQIKFVETLKKLKRP